MTQVNIHGLEPVLVYNLLYPGNGSDYGFISGKN